MVGENTSRTSSPPNCQAWFCTTRLSSDIVVEIDRMTFHLHKIPLMSKSKKLYDLITQQENQHSRNKNHPQNDDVKDEEHRGEEQQQCHVSLTSFPGGPKTFETAVKFCYGVMIQLTAENVAPLRCAGEALEMTEEHSENNLIAITEKFNTQYVLTNIKHSITSLISCERILPFAEKLDIVRNYIQIIANTASLYDPTIFGWVEDLAKLNHSLFNRVISSMKEKEINNEIIEHCLIYYAKRCFPGITPINRRQPDSCLSIIESETEQREILENVISNMSQGKSLRSPTMTRFMFGILRMVNILNVSRACKDALERKIGEQLEQATLDDLLITSYSYLNETLYDVDCVERILDYFLKSYEEAEMKGENIKSPALMLVGRLIDGYLSEIASDSNLKPEIFCKLAASLPEQARLYDDGVYRSVDVYLKAHPWILEEEREKISGVMNYEKLTLEACTHAAQNERLPLRAIVQVLFFEQLQLRQEIAETLLTSEAGTVVEERQDSRPSTPKQEHNNESENQELRLGMDTMKARVYQLERECSTMKKFIAKVDTNGVAHSEIKMGRKKGLFTRKFGCKFRTQVCDSHESSVWDARKCRNHSNNHQ